MTKTRTEPRRISTGVPGADIAFCGGLIAGNSYLLSGAAGCGKTILSLQWLLDGVRCGEPGMYLTLAEPGADIVGNAGAFGWDLGGIDIVDLSPTGEDLGTLDDEYHVFPPSEVEKVSIWKATYQAIRAKAPRRLVIDSVTHMRYLSTDEYQFRKFIQGLVNFLKKSGCTTILALDPSEAECETAVSLAVDGIIRLRREISPSAAIGVRSLQIEKMRGSDFLSGLHPLRLSSQGITVFPHIVEKTGEKNCRETNVDSGVPHLDELLGGGIASGTVTLLSGPTGAGKSTLGAQILRQNAKHMRSVLFSFEESPEMIRARARSIGLPLDNAVASGAIQLVRVNSLELYPDEFLALVREKVTKDSCRLVMIDGLRGYELAMEEFGKPLAHIHNLVTYLRRMGVTTILINETEYITSSSLRATDIGVSHLADNVILLRYAELMGRVIKVISCLKKRTGDFQPELREMRIGSEGIKVGEKLEHLQGLLTGVPTYIKAT